MKKKQYTKKLSTYREVEDYVQDNLAIIKQLYLEKDMTARKVAERLNVQYSQLFQKACFKHAGRKGKGHGGFRPGSGNKPGTKFCGTCRQLLENCECE